MCQIYPVFKVAWSATVSCSDLLENDIKCVYWVVNGGLFRVKVKGQRSRVTSGSFFVLTTSGFFFVLTTSASFFVLTTSGSFYVLATSGSFFVLTITGSFFVVTTSCSFFVLIFFRVDHFLIFFRVDPFRIFFRGGHSLAYFVNIHEKGGVIMKSNEAVDWQMPSEWKRRLWIGNEKMFRAFDVTKIENLFWRKW